MFNGEVQNAFTEKNNQAALTLMSLQSFNRVKSYRNKRWKSK